MGSVSFWSTPPDLSGYASLSQVPNFINNGAFQTVANLLANFPAGSSFLGKYARVSDLWGSVSTVMICEQDAGTGTYYWRPQRTDYAIPSTQTSGTLSLIPMVTAPVINMQSTLLGAVTVTPATTNVWPGCRFEINAPASLGIFSVSFNGLVGGLVQTILGGNRKTLIYSSAGWTAS